MQAAAFICAGGDNELMANGGATTAAPQEQIAVVTAAQSTGGRFCYIPAPPASKLSGRCDSGPLL